MTARTRLTQATAAVVFVVLCAHVASAQTTAPPAEGKTQRREPPTAKQPYVVMTGKQVVDLEQRLRPAGREEVVGASGGLQTLMYVQSEKDKVHEAEVHEAADDYHMVLEGAATYTLGGRLADPREIRPGEWRAKGVVGGKTFEVGKGDIVFVPRGVVHQRDTRGRAYSMMLVKVYAEMSPVNTSSPAATEPAKGADAKKFFGLWRLVDSDEVRPSGEAVRARGQRPRGLLVYGENGDMTVQVMNDGRPKFKGAAPAEGTPDEVRAAFTGYTAYFGKFEVDERERAVLHHMEGNLVPNEIGTTRKRFYEFSGDRLILSAPVEAGGERRTRRIIWERVK